MDRQRKYESEQIMQKKLVLFGLQMRSLSTECDKVPKVEPLFLRNHRLHSLYKTVQDPMKLVLIY